MSIEFASVSKQYQLGKTTVDALKNVTLSVKQGEFVAIIGPSGSGKSTMLHLFGALDRPTSGTVTINDIEISKMNDKQLARLRRVNIGFVFQSFNLIPMLSVYANVEFPLLLMKVKKSERKERVMDILEQVGLTSRANHKTEELSGGQRQRVAMARALVGNPRIVLSDEPTANLDSKTGEEVLDLMQELNEKNNVTLVYATHDKSIISRAKRIVNILDGEIIKSGDTAVQSGTD
ncbi:MAG: ABC transporter ATP-binding protein [Deltaproteobacteria bacterium]|jgi:putative ABC transport system ATP-binding protein|nr:ABC transporter ATP-binding protein [Deltaproteobacteria bacterium]MBT4263535.1 ABC transporter ATP-binding protein [Deltaproteobacteria bacterium]MBT4637837.1 ABC transporter ATP-binding protein [Deltaproteobacteria bacterium]MBT6500139.1 ABC transporter ATP-binding protein [Deltaproteobacteria bacterium]MBT6614895.1 ABC transporter ATP-binding protein [Deltaproteobacteria bacterium]